MEKLYPVTNSGYNYYKDTTYYATKEVGKVSGVMFLNQGTNSRVKISFAGCDIILLPGQGQEITMPTFGYDTSVYQITFSPINPASDSLNNLAHITQKFTDL